MKGRDHLSAFMLPFGVLIVIPACLLLYSHDTLIGWQLSPTIDTLLIILGLILIFCGVVLLAVTIKMFYQLGKGTLAPWAPTKNLVVEGIYGRIRNPMISGVILIAFGEGFILSSWLILLWGIIIILGNHIYFIYSEEPGLVRRFGDDYILYKKNVPRWIPRRTPWIPNQELAE